MQNTLNGWLASNSQKKILLLRHGTIETGSDEKRFVGQTDLPLSDVGKRQAKYWRDCLAKVPLDHICCSDLTRCDETARIIAADRVDIEHAIELREINLGQWEGLTFARVKNRWPDAFQQRGSDLARFRPPAGESFNDLGQRVIPAFEKAVGQPGKTLLIVAHAGVIRMILCHLLGMPVKNLFRIAQDYAAMNLIDREANGYRIQLLNRLPA